MIISLSGVAGSGKSTVAEMVCKKLNLKEYNIGQIRRDLAKERGMTLEEYNKLGEKDPTTDYIADDFVKRLGREEDNFLIQSRTAYHFIPNSVKVFLNVDIDEAARRRIKDIKDENLRKQRNEAKADTIKEVKKLILEREESDRKRYLKYYNIDYKDMKNYDLVVDTTKKTPSEVIEEIVNFVRKK